jgi:hypothetical protein
VEKGLTFYELHREEPPAVLTEELTKRNQIGMVEIRECSELVLEPIDVPAVEVQQRLQSHARAGLVIECLVDDTHPAPPDLALEGKAFSAFEEYFPPTHGHVPRTTFYHGDGKVISLAG